MEPRGYDGTRYLIGFTKEFINWLDMQDFKDKHTTRRLHLDNDIHSSKITSYSYYYRSLP